MTLATTVTLDDKYTSPKGRLFLNGLQALVRLTMLQQERDGLQGLNTACYVSGYRGSPLGGLDKAFWSAQKYLENRHIQFHAGVNEDLAATAVWGSQQVNLFPGAKYDGVFSMWYGKGPGVDRSGDVFKHGNLAGSSKNGGVVLLAGDDHACKSSTAPHQSEFAFMDASIPVLNPAGIQDILDMGIYAWALSRYSGCWVAFKTIAETVDSGGSFILDLDHVTIKIPEDFELPPEGLNIRWPDPPLEQEKRLQLFKLPAAQAFIRANHLDYPIYGHKNYRVGIVTTGKSYLDVRQALENLGITTAVAQEIGLNVYKVGMTWPLEPENLKRFAEPCELLIVVEEKRPLLEPQIKDILYHLPGSHRPKVIGKRDDHDHQTILTPLSELSAAKITLFLANLLKPYYNGQAAQDHLAVLEAKMAATQLLRPIVERIPYYCSGCPHNTSTRVPEGSRALAGIGCHYMATWIDHNTATFTQMGGEGVPWLGQAPFTETEHVFANLGDGTYYHSGILAIRAAVAGKVNITYKILYNDAVAMTGGQHVDGPLDVFMITHQVYNEGVRTIAVMSDYPEKYTDKSKFAPGTTIHHRDELNKLQQELRQVKGTSVLLYDQTCAAEKRRRRKRGLMEDPPKRVFINETVCEACGDCSVKSNCLSVVPIETEFGTKRAIDQSSCNKDYSCVKGFCPSFVTVHGGGLRKGEAFDLQLPELIEPNHPKLDRPFNILVTGVGGTGVVTIGAILGMAAHLENKGCTTLDMTGLAQKYGAVTSHVRIAAEPKDIHAVRIASGQTDLLLACDNVVATLPDVLDKVQLGRSYGIINTHETITGVFTKDPYFHIPVKALDDTLEKNLGQDHCDMVDATKIATKLLGDAIGANMFMVGYAYQRGQIPIHANAIEKAIELNAVSVKFNTLAFRLGRALAQDPALYSKLMPEPAEHPKTMSLDELVAQREQFLKGYQNKAYAKRYRQLVNRVWAAEQAFGATDLKLTMEVAKSYAKLLAYKDEYEVARLYTNGDFMRRVKEQFAGDYKLNFHLAPPLFAKRDPSTGELIKKQYGPWMLTSFRLLAKLKFLRGTALDIFGYSQERKWERSLIGRYEQAIDKILAKLSPDTYETALKFAALPDRIRGYGHIKEANWKKVEPEWERLEAIIMV